MPCAYNIGAEILMLSPRPSMCIDQPMYGSHYTTTIVNYQLSINTSLYIPHYNAIHFTMYNYILIDLELWKLRPDSDLTHTVT